MPSPKKCIIFFIIMLIVLVFCGCSHRGVGNYTVKYESMGGTIFFEHTGSEVIAMPIPKKDGYTFEGWYEHNDYSGQRVNFPYIIEYDVTLYAKYIDNNIGNLELVYNLLEGEYEVKEYKGSSFVIFIPEKHNGLPVTRLCENFIKNLYNTTVLYISKNVSQINEKLYLNRRLNAIEVNGNNSTFSSLDGILYNKDRTILISYPSGRLGDEYILPAETLQISPNGIRNNMYLQYITLNKNVFLLDKAISDLISLKDITVPVENQSFCSDNSVLYNKDKTRLILFPAKHTERFFVVPDTVINISDNAFMNSTLDNLILGNNVQTVDSMQNCKNLKRIRVLKDNPYFADIDGVLFDKKGENLIKFPSSKNASGDNYDYIFPSSVKRISSFAFDGVKETKEIFINKSLKIIESYAFCNETLLESIYFEPESKLEKIESGAFLGCDNLVSLTINSRIPPIIGVSEFDECLNLKIYVPENMRGLYEEIWSGYKSILKNGTALENYTMFFDSQTTYIIGNVTAGFILIEPIPLKEGYNFMGWYDNKDGTGNRYFFPRAIVENITLYAAWE